MAFGTQTLVFEVRTTGNDANGGAFDSGVSSPGTDYSQQNAAQVTYTDLAIDALDTTKLTSAAHPFDSTSPGNVINISGGTGFTTGLYRVVSVSGSTATMDRSVGTASSTGGTGKLGGAFLTISKATANMQVNGQIIYVKAGTYQISSTISNPSGSTPSSIGRIVGYTTTRGDAGRATIQATSSLSGSMFINSVGYSSSLSWENIIFDGNSHTVSCFNCSGNLLLQFLNCLFKNFNASFVISGTYVHGGINIQSCEFSNNTVGGGSGGVIFFNCNGSYPGAMLSVTDSYFTNNNGDNQGSYQGQIVVLDAGVNVSRCIIYNNTGALMSGLVLTSPMAGNIENNAIVSNTLAGITLRSDNGPNVSITNNIISGNGTGISCPYANTPSLLAINHNAYWNNTTDKSGFTAGGGEVSLTSSPFVSAGTNFALNSTAGGGLACQGAATPGTIGLSSVVGTSTALDIGPLQHTASSGFAFTFVA
jgi:hypothetical protein